MLDFRQELFLQFSRIVHKDLENGISGGVMYGSTKFEVGFYSKISAIDIAWHLTDEAMRAGGYEVAK